MPVLSPTATLSANKAADYVGNAMLWKALVKKYERILKPVWVVQSGKRTNKTYLVSSIDLALEAAYRDQAFTTPEKS
jgi:hypothetical protein